MIEFTGVGKSFQVRGESRAAIADVDLAVESGEIITLVGPSGCGKSTLLNMAAGMFPPTAGRVSYRGVSIEGLNQRVGYMTQQDHLLLWRTVGDNIGLPLEIKRVPRADRNQRTHELIQLVGLEGFDAYYPSQISGGMKKRCALARLLAYDPETLLMDEPFGALDAQMRLGLQAELLSICRRLGKTVLFVTHDIDEAVALADRCVVFRGRPGRVAQVIDIDLPPDRNIASLRFDERYVELTRHVWGLMSPDFAAHEEKR